MAAAGLVFVLAIACCSSLAAALPPGYTFTDDIGQTGDYRNDPTWLTRSAVEFGLVFTAYIDGRPTVFVLNCSETIRLVVNEPELVEVRAPDAWLGMMGDKALPTAAGAAHARLAKLYGPALAPAAIASYVPVLDAAAAAYAAALAASPAPANVGAQGAAAVVGGLAVSIFGRAFTTEELAALTDATVKMIGGANAVNIDTPFTNYGVALAGTRALRTLVQGLIAAKIAALQASPVELVPSMVGNVLKALVSQGTPLNKVDKKELEDMVVALLFAGFSPAPVVGRVMWELGGAAGLDAVRAEQAAHMDASPGPISLAALNAMPRLDALWKEAVVAAHGVNGVFRQAAADITVGGHPVEKGTFMILLTLACNKQRPDGPDLTGAFDASPWVVPGNGSGACPVLAPDPQAFVPFGAGLRQCPGRYLATSITKMTIAHLSRVATWKQAKALPFYFAQGAFVDFTPDALTPAAGPTCPGVGRWPDQPPRPESPAPSPGSSPPAPSPPAAKKRPPPKRRNPPPRKTRRPPPKRRSPPPKRG